VKSYALRAGALVVALLALAACAPAPPEFRGTTYAEPKPADDFTLTDQFGEPFRLADHRGEVLLLFFGYAHCPDVCPVTLSNWARAREGLAQEKDVEYVFITVDPERDTIERLREHMAIFSEDFVGLTGTAEELQSVYEDYGIFQKKMQLTSSAAGYVVDHSTVMLVVDRKGRLRITFPFDAKADDIVHDVRRLLEEPAPRIRIEGAWSRPTAASPAPGVAYFEIVNEGGAPDRLLGARSDRCGTIEIHRTTVEDGRARMAPANDGVEVAARSTTKLEPGGHHLMLFELSPPLAPADRYGIVLDFEKSGEVPVEVEVRRP